MRMRKIRFGLPVLLLLAISACAGKASPATIATTVANNGTLVVQAIDEVQKFVIAQEAEGRIPRNQAVTVMEGIGRALQASKTASGYVDQLIKLPTDSTDQKPLIDKIQDSLAIASSEVGMALVPIDNAEVRAQVGKLAGSVSRAIAEVNKVIVAVIAAKGGGA